MILVLIKRVIQGCEFNVKLVGGKLTRFVKNCYV